MLNKFNYNKIVKFSFSILLKRLFNPLNISKVLIIFIFGLISRVIVNYIYEINIFLDYTPIVSLTYYAIFAFFVVLVHELVTYFNFSIIPLSLINCFFSFKRIILKVFSFKKWFIISLVIYFLISKLFI